MQKESESLHGELVHELLSVGVCRNAHLHHAHGDDHDEHQLQGSIKNRAFFALELGKVRWRRLR